MSNNESKVIIGMSGGVDSSTAALLLKNSGYEVIGVMLDLWTEKQGKFSDNSKEFAAEACRRISIPFHFIDCRDIFYNEVVSPFIENYLSGKTPNPCPLCNLVVRWKVLLEIADSMNAEFIATGHYARLIKDQQNFVHLYRGADETKDQSYVLSRLPERYLSRTIFPLGNYVKSEIRKIASENNLTCADRPDSQDICFIYDGNYRKFIFRQRGNVLHSGNIIDKNRNIIGVHEGLLNYTIGQRKGIRVFSNEPYYVMEKNISSNELIVGRKDELQRNIVLLEKINIIRNDFPKELFVQFRYRAKAVEVKSFLFFENQTMKVFLMKSQPDIAPGQLAVFYSKEGEVFVSGIISRTMVTGHKTE